MIDHTLLSISMLRPANDNLIELAGTGQGKEPEQP
jgi:hypothetical protein